MTWSAPEIWGMVAALAVGTFVIRFSFLGLVSGSRFPSWVLRLLRYTPVAVLPGLVAPLVMATDPVTATVDPLKIAAALVTIGLGIWTRSVIIAAGGGALVFFGAVAVLG